MSKMQKNYDVLRLAGLLNEQAGPPMGAAAGGGADPMAGAGQEQPDQGDQGGGDDPAALVDQAIDILNKLKAALGGGQQGQPDQGM